MVDAAVIVGEENGGLRGNNRGFEVGTGEQADGAEGAPGGFDDDFDVIFLVTERDAGTEIACDAAEFWQNIIGKVFEIFRQ
jgi:hypothetical protein